MSQESKDIPGILTPIEMTDYQTQLFLEYMGNHRKNEDFDVIFGIFGDKSIKFCDMFAGKTIKMPRRRELLRIIEYIKVYTYVRSKGDIEIGIQLAAQKFGKKTNSVKRVYEHVDALLSDDIKNTLYGGIGDAE